jgi:L,D-peptidoglycan transpeptidase YkuD (ErfK/YbiS/YcfS/YnhG family)
VEFRTSGGRRRGTGPAKLVALVVVCSAVLLAGAGAAVAALSAHGGAPAPSGAAVVAAPPRTAAAAPAPPPSEDPAAAGSAVTGASTPSSPTTTPANARPKAASPAAAAKNAKPTSSPKPVVPKALPARMVRQLPGSTQIIVVTAARLGSNTGTLKVFNKVKSVWVQVLSTPANLGKTGLIDGATRVQGHLNTPTGIWYISPYVFGQHAKAPSGTKMPYRHITQRSWWSAAPGPTYNTWVESSKHVSGEHLADSTVQYQYALDSGFNAPPNQRVDGRGTAIFLHCFEPAGNALGKFTHGCVAIAPAKMVAIFRLLDPARRPTFAIGTLVKGTPTSIWAY